MDANPRIVATAQAQADLLETAWELIAEAAVRSDVTEDWRAAVARWRDLYHAAVTTAAGYATIAELRAALATVRAEAKAARLLSACR